MSPQKLGPVGKARMPKDAVVHYEGYVVPAGVPRAGTVDNSFTRCAVPIVPGTWVTEHAGDMNCKKCEAVK